MKIVERSKMKGGKNPSAPKVDKPKCPTHHKDMAYLPQQLVWACSMIGCKMTARVSIFGDQSAPTILRGTMEFVVADGAQFIYFPESSILFPVALLPAGSKVTLSSDGKKARIITVLDARNVETKK